VEVFETTEICIEFIAELMVADLEERVCLRHTDYGAVHSLFFADKTKLFELIDPWS